MAIQIKNTYSGRTDNTDPNYPYGKGRNVVGGVEGTGTPFEADWYNNLEGFLQGLLLEAEVTPDGEVDNANSSQLVEAVKGLGKSASKVITSDGRNVQERLDNLPSEVDAAGTAATLIEGHNSDAEAHPELSSFITSEADRAEIAADAVLANQPTGVIVFTTYALLDAYTPADTDEQRASYKVTNDPDSSLNGYYHWVSGTAYEKDADLVVNTIDENNTSDAVSGAAVYNYILKEPVKNIYSTDFNIQGGYINTSNNITSSENSIYAKIPITGEQVYSISKDDSVNAFNSFFIADDTGAQLYSALYQNLTNGIFTAPENSAWLYITIYSDVSVGIPDQSASLQIEKGTERTAYAPYELEVVKIGGKNIKDNTTRGIVLGNEQKALITAANTISLYDSNLTFIGFADEATPIPVSFVLNNCWIATESGTVFGVSVSSGQLIIDTGSSYNVVNIPQALTEDSITTIPSTNMANLELITDGFYITGTGAISANVNGQYIRIPVEELTEYAIGSDWINFNLSFTAIRYEDSSGNLSGSDKIQLLPTGPNGDRVLTTPASTVFVYFNTVVDPSFVGGYDVNINTLQFQIGDTLSDYTPYAIKLTSISDAIIYDEISDNRLTAIENDTKNKELKTNKNIAILGDSITAGSNGLTWVDVLEDSEMFANIHNVAKSGARWSHQASTVYDITLGVGNNVMWNQANAVIDSVTNLTQPQPDVWLIMCGRNDANFDIGDVGTIFTGDILTKSPETILTIIEGVRYTCETILTQYPDAEIVLVTPIQWYELTYSLPYDQGRAIIDAGLRLSAKSIDAGGECGIYRYFDTATEHRYLLDGTHPNADGVAKLGNYMKWKLQQILDPVVVSI